MDSPELGGAAESGSQRNGLVPEGDSHALESPNLPNRDQDPKCPTSMEGIQVEFFRPVDALESLAGDNQPGSEAFEALREKLEKLPGFLRVSEHDLMRYACNFEQVVNITGYSGQGIHAGQRRILQEAFAAIMADKKWGPNNTLLISGGTALGVPDSAISILSGREHYPAVAMMALPGVAYPLTDGYTFVCAEDGWKNWGDETAAMGRIATETIIAGGGAQAFEDALFAARDKEPVAVIVNTYNASARVEYVLDGKRGDVIIKADAPDIVPSTIVRLSDLERTMREALVKQGLPEEDAQRAHLCALPVSGLVTELKNGQRRACGQDLLYFAITGNAELLPKQFQSSDPSDTEKLRLNLAHHLDLYYLLDDPNEGIYDSAVIKLNDALCVQNVGLLDRVIDHAVMHDVHNSSTGHFGPVALGAKSPEELAQLLKRALHLRIQGDGSRRAEAG